MNLVIITRPDIFDGETALVDRLFRRGMPRLHLRKPKASRKELSAWIEQISPEYRRRIVLHDHHSLVREYHLGGIHLNGRNPDVPSWAANGSITISRSCHFLEEVARYKAECDYLFLSPIYDSISKEGYGAAFSRATIATARERGIIDEKVYALGGISAANLPAVTAMGFGGAAVLGDLWMAESPEDHLSLLCRLCEG